MAFVMAFSSLFLLVAVLMMCVVFIVPLFCVIDAATRSSQEFERADSNKTLWIVLPLVFGIFASIVYLIAIRPKLKAMVV